MVPRLVSILCFSSPLLVLDLFIGAWGTLSVLGYQPTFDNEWVIDITRLRTRDCHRSSYASTVGFTPM